MALTLSGSPDAPGQQAWQASIDPLTSSAAASVVVHLACGGSEAANAALKPILHRLSQAAYEAASSHGANPTAVAHYTSDSLGLKVRAITQSSGVLPCAQLASLRTMARANGFDTP